MTDKSLEEEVKRYVLDTNVLMHDHEALTSFEDNHVVISLDVHRELERNRKGNEEHNKNARNAISTIDDICESSDKSPSEGIPMGEGRGRLFVVRSPSELPEGYNSQDLDMGTVDDRNIALTRNMEEETGTRTVLVTKDKPVKIRARALGIRAEDYEADRVDVRDALEKARRKKLHISPDRMDELYNNRFLDVDPDEDVQQGLDDLANRFYRVLSFDETSSALARFDKKKGALTLVNTDLRAYKIEPRNAAQHCLFDLLFDDDIQIVLALGPAGTGKTLLSLGAGIKQTIKDDKFDKVGISKPYVHAADELGFLPGEYEDKALPWLRSFEDALAELWPHGKFNSPGMALDYFRSSAALTPVRAEEYSRNKTPPGGGPLEILQPEYIRGRNLLDMFVFMDEAQNMTPKQAKTLMTRPGRGCKVVLAGDPSQVDRPYLDHSSNGLVRVMDKLMGKASSQGEYRVGAIALPPDSVERSEIAELSVRHL